MAPVTESGLVVPHDHPLVPKTLQLNVETEEAPAEPEEVEETQEEKRVRMASQLPEPTGYRVLVALPEVSDKTEGGIVKPHEAKALEEVATVCGYVLAKGPDAYSDPKRFPSGSWCEEGDWVVFRAFSGTRIRVHGQEFRLLNDDSIEATVEDPQGVERA